MSGYSVIGNYCNVITIYLKTIINYHNANHFEILNYSNEEKPGERKHLSSLANVRITYIQHWIQYWNNLISLLFNVVFMINKDE